MIILGVNYSIDSAAGLVGSDGIRAAASEERFNRQKHTRAFPQGAIEFCLNQAGIELTELDAVAFFWNPGEHLEVFNLRRSGRWRHHTEYLINLPNYLLRSALPGHKQGEVEFVYQEFALRGRRPLRVYYIDHHLAHCASTFFVSPFEESAILTQDGYGERTCTLFARGEGNSITPLRRIYFPHSLGAFYAAITQYLGYRANWSEGKLMALAGYGEPSFYEKMRRIVKVENGNVQLDLSYFSFYIESKRRYTEKFIKEFGPERKRDEEINQRHCDIASSAQKVLEEGMLELARWLHRRTGSKRLCLAGGVALNSVANGRILLEAPFDEVFIQPGAGDEGSSIGSALYLLHHIFKQPRRYVMEHAFLGPEYSDEEIESELKEWGLIYEKFDDIAGVTAEILAEGKFVGWFQGRMEFGPRALGGRSILADPRRAEVKDILNSRVKHREPYRPYAPTVLEEACGEYFGSSYPSPFMLLVYRVRPEKRSVVPAIVHIDGSARVQSINERQHPLYWRVVKRFGELTGVPVVLNTSFNFRGEPIVNTPRDAVKCFMTTGLDALAIGSFLVVKNPAISPSLKRKAETMRR